MADFGMRPGMKVLTGVFRAWLRRDKPGLIGRAVSPVFLREYQPVPFAWLTSWLAELVVAQPSDCSGE